MAEKRYDLILEPYFNPEKNSEEKRGTVVLENATMGKISNYIWGSDYDKAEFKLKRRKPNS